MLSGEGADLGPRHEIRRSLAAQGHRPRSAVLDCRAASRRPTSIDENDLGVGPSATSDTACATARSAGRNRPPARRSEAVLPSPDTFTALIDRTTGKDGEFDRIQCERER
jgi:hypothetical protein